METNQAAHIPASIAKLAADFGGTISSTHRQTIDIKFPNVTLVVFLKYGKHQGGTPTNIDGICRVNAGGSLGPALNLKTWRRNLAA
jgi:hypothetical protein